MSLGWAHLPKQLGYCLVQLIYQAGDQLGCFLSTKELVPGHQSVWAQGLLLRLAGELLEQDILYSGSWGLAYMTGQQSSFLPPTGLEQLLGLCSCEEGTT